MTLGAIPMPTFPRNLLTPRFSLRAMLVVVTVGCVVIGWRANRLFQNQRAIEAIKDSGFNVFIPESAKDTTNNLSFWGDVNVESMQLTQIGSERAPRIWCEVRNVFPLSAIWLNCVALPERQDGEAALCQNRVSSAHFYLCFYSGNSLSYALQQMPQLKSLTLLECFQDSAQDLDALEALSHCKELEKLAIIGSQVTPNLIARLDLQHIQSLTLKSGSFGARITLSERDIQTIAQMKHLRSLTIETGRRGSYPESTLQLLGRCEELKELCLDMRARSDAELEAAKGALKKALPACKVTLIRIPVR